MNEHEIDRALEAALGPHSQPAEVDRQLLERIPAGILPNLTAVRRLPSPWVLAARLIALVAVVAFATAYRLGLYGIHTLNAVQSTAIFSALAILICLAAMANAAAMVPAARQLVRPVPLVALASLALAAIFALTFQNFTTARFVQQGLPCLKAGLLDAIPAALLVWLVLRRGFVLHTAAAGAGAGALAGLAGVLMLELHCPIMEAPHAMVWHVAVIPLSTLAGAAAGRLARR